MKIYNLIKYIDVYETTSGQIILGNGAVIIPFINALLMPGNPVNGRHSFVDFSYIIFSKIEYINIQCDGLNIDLSITGSPVVDNIKYMIINNLDESKNIHLNISSMENYLILPDFCSIRDDFFSPYDTPLRKSDMDNLFVESFLANKTIPLDLLKFVGSNYLIFNFR